MYFRQKAFTNGIKAASPRAHAVLLFYDFLISEEGQKPASRDVKWPLKANIKVIEPGQALDQSEKWQKLFQEIVLKRS